MTQLDLFNECYPEPKKKSADGIEWKLFIDGASRKNPGPAGAGICLYKNGDPALMRGFYLGEKTNNQAEYMALLIGVFFAKKYASPDDSLYIFSDSELLVKQVIGAYKIKKPHLQALNKLAHVLLKDMTYSICHVLRHKNTEADAMANEGVDKKNSLPPEFRSLMHAHGITL